MSGARIRPSVTNGVLKTVISTATEGLFHILYLVIKLPSQLLEMSFALM